MPAFLRIVQLAEINKIFHPRMINQSFVVDQPYVRII